MIPISDLRKGNLIKTEYGILPVHAIIFNEVQVKGKDGRILWAKETEGVLLEREEVVWGRTIKYVHERQNIYYWLTGFEIEIK